ncbi:MAG: hypothetical protein HZB12_03125 [Candidatus Yonathbacteria bacterium]|nr:hypothetical protein [Candidatus Yonathbacteria bacterium]
MESSELALYRGLGAVRNYGAIVLIALFALNAGALGMLNWVETNDLKSELMTLSQKLPNPTADKTEQTLSLPEDIIAIRFNTKDRTGFYETRLEKEYLAYANPDKQYTLLKAEDSLRHEIQNFALVLSALYVGEVAILLGWWFFIRSKVRELFEIL